MRATAAQRTPRDVREVEAECVALICCASLGLGGEEFSRGYIQHWLKGHKQVPDRSDHRIFRAADRILKAGIPDSGEPDAANRAALAVHRWNIRSSPRPAVDRARRNR